MDTSRTTRRAYLSYRSTSRTSAARRKDVAPVPESGGPCRGSLCFLPSPPHSYSTSRSPRPCTQCPSIGRARRWGGVPFGRPGSTSVPLLPPHDSYKDLPWGSDLVGDCPDPPSSPVPFRVGNVSVPVSTPLCRGPLSFPRLPTPSYGDLDGEGGDPSGTGPG